VSRVSSACPSRTVRPAMLSGSQFCLIRALANFVSRVRRPRYLPAFSLFSATKRCCLPTFCRPAIVLLTLPRFGLPILPVCHILPFLPRFAATFTSQTAAFACHFCLVWWSRDPFRLLYKSDSGRCQTHISRSAYRTLNTERASNLARTLSWWDRRY